jgi:hypothetical protein
MSRRMWLEEVCYPRADENVQQIIDEERATRARDSIDPSDLLAVTQHVLLEIAEDRQHPFWPLIVHCTKVGTLKETGKLPHMAEQVGAALLPMIDKAIARLVGERIDDFSAWD